MIALLHRLPDAFRSLPSCLLAVALGLVASIAPAAKLPADAGSDRDLYPALGISDDFGRWPGTIRLVYDPDGAPSGYNNARVLALIEEAFSYWTTVSGLRFEIGEVDAGAADDRNASPFQRDGLVRISWGALGAAAGRAGPLAGFYNDDLGYFPFHDGTIELNNEVDAIASEDEFLHILVHEIGHLIGLGHSDNPDSVLYSNPYNHLRYPRPDDIRAVQVLYGPPATAVPIDTPLPQWLYVPPPQANPALTQNLFKPNAHPQSGSGAYFSVGDTTITSVTASLPDDEFVAFYVGLTGGTEIDATFVLVDPTGYVHSESSWALSCPAANVCVNAKGLTQAGIMKTMPGLWKIHVINAATERTLYSGELRVDTVASFNQPPVATLTAVAGPAPTQMTFTLRATDPEGDSIEAVWHPPGISAPNTDIRSRTQSGGSATLTVDFAQMGTHTFFIEVRDTAPRYSAGSTDGRAAGEGFQTLLRVTVTLPAGTVQVVSTQDLGTQPTTSPTQEVLAGIASTPNPMLVANANGSNVVSNVAASFTYGASANGGATTSTNFRTSDNVIIAGGVRPLAADVGKAGDIFIVVRTILNGVETWTYRDASGEFVPWPSVMVSQLQPAYSVASLQPSEAFEILAGNLMAAEHRVYIGYRPSGSNTLLYTGEALRLFISN